MKRLIRLPNGDAMRPDFINAVIVAEREESILNEGHFYPDRVIVRTADNNSIVIDCESLEGACEMRDSIFEAVNA